MKLLLETTIKSKSEMHDFGTQLAKLFSTSDVISFDGDLGVGKTFLCKSIINYLTKINTIVALGKIAFDACLNFYMQDFAIKRKDFIFQHGVDYLLPDNKILIGSYHPSPRNVNTGRIDENKMLKLLKKVKKVMDR